jgi:carbamoyltransferase
MSKKDTYILGTHLSHDGSACLLKNGHIVVAIEKERLTRRKHDGGNDTLAIEYCLQAAGITINDLDLVVQNANFEKETLKIDNYAGKRIFTATYNVPVITISHHLAHAYSTIGTCPFYEDYTIYIADGSGSPYKQCDDLIGAFIPEKNIIDNTPENFWCEKDSLYYYSNNKLQPVYKDFSEFNHVQPKKPLKMPSIIHSIGGVYQAISQYCFGNVDDTGKLMGLSPYGKKGIYPQPIFELKDGRVFNTFDWMDEFTTPVQSYQDFKSNFQYYANIARYVQDETEKALIYLFTERQKNSPASNWCYAGGVALNAVANQRILAETGIKNLYIQPAAGDNGIAIGCAYYGWLEVLKKEKQEPTGKTNFGKKYGPSIIKNVISQDIEETPSPTIALIETENWIEETAQLLAKGKVIGWFVDGCEFGPRALGFRSILADPRKEGVRDYINREIKNREDFRPFAPAILREDCHTYFKYDWDTPYMIMVNPVMPEWEEELKNVVHLNGTARVQTVTENNNPAFYKLLKEFKKITGLPILLNTSFNNRGMPIVETPQQALNFFKESPLDYLIFENQIVSKVNE